MLFPCRHWHNVVNEHHLRSPGEAGLVPVMEPTLSPMSVFPCRHWHNVVNEHHLRSPGEAGLVPVMEPTNVVTSIYLTTVLKLRTIKEMNILAVHPF